MSMNNIQTVEKELNDRLNNIEIALKNKEYKNEINLTNDLINWVQKNKEAIDSKYSERLHELYKRQINNLDGLLEHEKASKVAANLIELDKFWYKPMNKDQRILMAQDYLSLAMILNEANQVKKAILICKTAAKLIDFLGYKKNVKVAVQLIEIYFVLLQLYARKRNLHQIEEIRFKIDRIYNYYSKSYRVSREDELKVTSAYIRTLIGSGQYQLAESMLEFLYEMLEEEDFSKYLELWKKLGWNFQTLFQLSSGSTEPDKVDLLYSSSESIFKRILEVEKNEENYVQLANNYLFKGMAKLKEYPDKALKDFETAVDLFKKAGDFDHETRDDSALSLCYKRIARIFLDKRNYDKALEYIKKASKQDKIQISYFNNPKIIFFDADNDVFINMVYRIIEENDQAEEAYERAVKSYNEILGFYDDEEVYSRLIDLMIAEADFQDALHNSKKAVEIYEQVFNILKDQANNSLLEYCANRLDTIYRLTGENEKARALKPFLKELSSKLKKGDTDDLLLLRKFAFYYRQGILEEENGNYNRAIKSYLNAEVVLQKIRKMPGEISIKSYLTTLRANLGKCYFLNGQEELGASYLEGVVDYFKNTEDFKENYFYEMYMYSVLTLASYYDLQDRAEEAITILEPVLDLLYERLDKEVTDYDLMLIGSVYQLLPELYIKVGEIDEVNAVINEIIDLVLELDQDSTNPETTARLLDAAYVASIIDSSLIDDYISKIQILKQLFELLYKKGHLDYKTKLSLFNIYHELAMLSIDPEERKLLNENSLKLGEELQNENYDQDLSEIIDNIRDIYIKEV